MLPNLAAFDVKTQVVHGAAGRLAGTSALTLAYAGVYIAVLLVGAMAIFSRRDFK